MKILYPKLGIVFVLSLCIAMWMVAGFLYGEDYSGFLTGFWVVVAGVTGYIWTYVNLPNNRRR